MNNKFLILIIAVIAACVVISGCINSDNTNKTKNYTGNGYSFTYPGDWSVSKMNGSSSNDIVSVDKAGTLNDTKVNGSGVTTTLTTSFLIQKSSTNGMSEDVILNLEEMIPDNYEKISTGNRTIDGKTVKTTIYRINNTQTGKISKEISMKFVKDGYIYYISVTAPENSFDSEQANFDLILNSLKFQ